MKQELYQVLRQTIRPEFLNRIDEVIVFRPLGQSEIREIVTLQLKQVQSLVAKKGLVLDVTSEAKDWLAKLGYDPTFGARPLKRVIQKHIINPLSARVLMAEFVEGDTVEVGLDAHGLIAFKKLVLVDAVK